DLAVESMSETSFDMTLLAVFGATALFLATIGIYGLMAYTVQMRTQELGIRRALGADASAVRRLIVGEGMTVALAGLVAGLVLAFGLARLLQSFLFGVSAQDPVTFAAVSAAL